MTPFTDDNLKRLKEHSHCEVIVSEEAGFRSVLNDDEFKALLARLEAGELALSSLISLSGGLSTREITVWRKACGK